MTRPVLEYQSGFGNVHGTEAVPGALPVGQNAPQRPPKGLYAEVISGTSFTAPRAENLSAWLYRLRPSALHAPFRRVTTGRSARGRSMKPRRRPTGCAGIRCRFPTLRPISWTD